MRHVRALRMLVAAAAVLALTGVQPAVANNGVGQSTVSVTALDPDGVHPDGVGRTTNVIAGSSGSFLAFTYTAGRARPHRADALSIDVPAVWGGSSWDDSEFSADPERYETPGYVRVKQGSCASAGTLTAGPSSSGAGSTLELVGFACDARQSLSLELFYVTAPADPGRYDFPTQLQGRSLRAKDRPALDVHPVPDVALVLSEVPPSVEVHEPFGVVLTAVDDDGKVRRDYRGTVRLVAACFDEGPGDYTFTAADRGSRLMSGIVLGSSGQRTFGFRDVGNLARPGEAVTTVIGAGDEPPPECGVHYH